MGILDKGVAFDEVAAGGGGGGGGGGPDPLASGKTVFLREGTSVAFRGRNVLENLLTLPARQGTSCYSVMV